MLLGNALTDPIEVRYLADSKFTQVDHQDGIKDATSNRAACVLWMHFVPVSYLKTFTRGKSSMASRVIQILDSISGQ